MKKTILAFLLSITFLSNGQTLIKYKQMENPPTTTSLGVWGILGNTLGNNTSFIGSLDNRSFRIRTNNSFSHEFKVDSLAGEVRIVPDTNALGNNIGLTVYGSYQNNPRINLSGINDPGYLITNRATSVIWYLQTQTFAGNAGLDNFSIGTSANPAVANQAWTTDGYTRIKNRLRIGDITTSPTALIHFAAGSATLPAIQLTTQTTFSTGTQGAIWWTSPSFNFNGAGVFSTSVTSPTLYGSSSASGNLILNSNSSATPGLVAVGGATTSTVQSTSGMLNLYNSNATTNNYALIGFGQSATATNNFAKFGVQYSDRTGGSEDQDFIWGTVAAGAYAEKMRLLSTGAVGIGTTAPTATLDVQGNLNISSTATITGALKASSTMSLGVANLTGGNTGTVAVVTDVYFTIPISCASNEPADLTTYYFGNIDGMPPNITKYFRVNIPYACTLIGWELSGFTNGVVGTTESNTLSVVANNSSTVTLSSTISMGNNNTPSASAGFFAYSGTGLSTDFSAGDYFFMQWDTPTYATNPSSLLLTGYLVFKRK